MRDEMMAANRKAPAGSPSGATVDGLTIVGNLVAAFEKHSTVEQAAASCLRAICASGRWVAARFESSGSGFELSPSCSLRYPESEDVVGAVDYASDALVSRIVDISGAAHFQLYSRGPIEPADDAVVTIAATLLRGVIKRSTVLGERERADADRTRRWMLLKQSEDAMRERYARLYTAINNMNQGLAVYDGDGKLVLCNSLYATMYDLSDADLRPGTPVDKIADRRRAKGFDVADVVQEGAFETHGALALKNESRVWRLGDGRRIAVSVQPMWNGGWITTHEDTTERARFEKRISHLAHHDPLTDCSNRILFRQELDQALELQRQGGDHFAVLWLDLDRFKLVNDTMGHLTGDLVLQEVAERLRGCVRHPDLIGRLGGDEFALLQTFNGSAAIVDAFARRVREVLAVPFEIQGQRIALGTSIGICMVPEDTDDPDQVLLNADVALYRAKAEGRNTHCFFTPGMGAEIQTRRQLEVALRKALEDGAFDLYYQPIVDLKTGEIFTCEALLRWVHPEMGPISPSVFIPVAEEAGLMVPLGRWVLARACRDAATWPGNISVAVNVSPSHVKSQNLVEEVMHELQRSGLSPERLEVEITETVMMQDTDAALRVLNDLRALGVKLALDDFGTGYSSLAYLGRFPFSKIKIDRMFVAGLPGERSSHLIVKAITGLSEGLGVITTAEGVETASQLSAILALGCTQVQGFLFSRPVANEVLRPLLEKNEAESWRSFAIGSRRVAGMPIWSFRPDAVIPIVAANDLRSMAEAGFYPS